MYRVAVVTDGQEYPLLNQMLRLQNPVLKENAGNTPGYLKFKITPQHPHYDKIHPLSSEVFVYEDGVEIFRGRSITSEEEFKNKYAAYPIIGEKYDVLKQIISDLGFIF